VNTYLVKIFLKILEGAKCGGYHEGKDRYQTVAYLLNRDLSIVLCLITESPVEYLQNFIWGPF